ALTANMVIDATGLESDIGENRLLADLLTHAGAQRNAYGRFEVTPSFELAGTRAEPGRIYASGSITLGGYYAGVDSFLGLQYAALAIADDLASAGAVHKIGAMRSLSEWWRWVKNRPPQPLGYPSAPQPSHQPPQPYQPQPQHYQPQPQPQPQAQPQHYQPQPHPQAQPPGHYPPQNPQPGAPS
ncbi:MAG: hypothetical protein AAFO29_05150, partial [Actinomycetota bacterium]